MNKVKTITTDDRVAWIEPEPSGNVVVKNSDYKEMYIPRGVVCVICRGCSSLQKIELSEGVRMVICVGCNIKELYLPSTIRSVKCDRDIYISNLKEVMNRREYFYLQML